VTIVSRGRVAYLPLAAFLLATAGPRVFAEERPPVSATPATQVEITVVGGASEFRWARSLVGAGSPGMASARWMRTEHFDVSDIFDVAAITRAHVLACWLDFSEPKRGRLYFVAPSGQHFLLREVELSGRQTEVDRASLAEVLELSVAALMENERSGLTRSEAETLLADRTSAETARRRTAAKPESSPAVASAASRAPPESRSLLGLGVLFAAQVLSADLPLGQRVGIMVPAGRYLGSAWVSGFVSGEYQFAITTENSDIGMRLQTLAPLLGVEAGHLRPRPAEGAQFWWCSAFVRLGAGVDFDHVSPRLGTQSTAATLAPGHWSSTLVVRVSVGTSWALGRRLALDVRAFADIAPTSVHYDVSVNDEVLTAFSPWRVRPGLALAVVFR